MAAANGSARTVAISVVTASLISGAGAFFGIWRNAGVIDERMLTIQGSLREHIQATATYRRENDRSVTVLQQKTEVLRRDLDRMHECPGAG